MMGDSDGLRAILSDQLRPDGAFISCRPDHESVVGEFYAWDEKGPEWRMVLNADRFRHEDRGCIRLTTDHLDQVRKLCRTT